jgi:3-hydroxybutyryl-CoA dehydrogenase
MPLVEVIPSLLTEKTLAEKIYNLMKDWGKLL